MESGVNPVTSAWTIEPNYAVDSDCPGDDWERHEQEKPIEAEAGPCRHDPLLLKYPAAVVPGWLAILL